ncbi:MAG: hypothetical protein J5969_07910 [Lachnospiraceae bacterium]|nr:hypothetical protein [Lachnospiraceae bacterium]
MKGKRSSFFNNLGLKITSVVVALLMWLVVTNSSDPVVWRQQVNIPVRILNTELLTAEGKVYTILDDSATIPVVNYSAPRSIADSIKPENIVATADIQELTNVNTVRIHLSSNIYNTQIESIEGSIDSVKFSIEDRKTSAFLLQVSTNGEPANGYSVGDVTSEQNQIRVSGPESLVSAIRTASAVVDINGAAGNITTYADVRLYDKEGEQIPTANLTMNITSVKVSVSILATKTLPVSVTTTGQPASGYLVSGDVTVTPESVEMAGRTSALGSYSEITVPEEELDITGATETVVKEINITPYVPELIRFADSSYNGIVTVTVPVEAVASDEIDVSITDIAMENVPEGMTAEIVSEDLSPAAGMLRVKVLGLDQTLSTLQAAQLMPYVDVGAALALAGGEVEEEGKVIPAQVVLLLPEGVQAENTPQVNIQIRPADETPE